MAKNVWIDDAYEYSGDTLHYRVRMNGMKIYEGVATAEDFPIRIYLNRIAQGYLESTFPETTGVTQDKGASAVFTLNEMTYSGGSWVEGNTLYQETYIDAYEGVYEGCMAQPINGHADVRQRIFYTSYNEQETTIEI